MFTCKGVVMHIIVLRKQIYRYTYFLLASRGWSLTMTGLPGCMWIRFLRANVVSTYFFREINDSEGGNTNTHCSPTSFTGCPGKGPRDRAGDSVGFIGIKKPSGPSSKTISCPGGGRVLVGVPGGRARSSRKAIGALAAFVLGVPYAE